MNEERYTLTVEEAAKMLGIGRNLAYDLARTGELPALRLGKRLVILRQPFEKMLQGDIILPRGNPEGRERQKE